ncbi:hypothetical protein RhiirA5_366769 [Rhizophagus irregularis]|uniref:Uncharacterized protein n=1 Tax=Rhizophagus irregularis TaxID=588596 RepID=A0A2N0SHP0_9GLOM|nr:hypothetical protein RhiirA5_366769 [Rhizophagus irregularis]PKC75080.1 hypothetical protein RhiirA1_408240 [Rhizophagus irregularis]
MASSVHLISSLCGFKTIQQTARANEIIEGVKQFSLDSFGIAFIIIPLITKSPVLSTFHKFAYASVTQGLFFQSVIFAPEFVLISGILHVLKSVALISFASIPRRFFILSRQIGINSE